MKVKSGSRFILYIALTVLMMALIFIHSAMPADLSQMESDFLSDFLARLFHWEPETASFIVRKFAHFLEYTVLGVLISLTAREVWMLKRAGVEMVAERDAWTKKDAGLAGGASIADDRSPIPWLIYILSWGIGTFYALTDEVHQMFVPGRSCELRDMAIDAGGVLLGVIIMFFVWRRRSVRNGGSQT